MVSISQNKKELTNLVRQLFNDITLRSRRTNVQKYGTIRGSCKPKLIIIAVYYLRWAQNPF